MNKRRDSSEHVRDFNSFLDELGRLDHDAYSKWRDELITDVKKRQRNDNIKNFARIGLLGLGISVLVGHVLTDNDTQVSKFDDITILSDTDTPTELRLGAVASSITGVDNIAIICNADLGIFDSDPNDKNIIGGATLYPDKTLSGKTDILLDQSLCSYIEDPSRAEYTGNVALAVFSFAHEIGHVTGEHDEGITNCIAVELYPQVRDQLGLTDLLEGYDAASIAKDIPLAQYHSAGC